MTNIKSVSELIESGVLAGGKEDPMVTMQAAMALFEEPGRSGSRGTRQVRDSIGRQTRFIADHSSRAGIAEPVVAKPTTLEQAKMNMRVEFRIVKVRC